MRLVVLAALAALLLPSAALADGVSYVAEGGVGVLSPDGKYRYVAVSTGRGTAIERIAVHGGAVTGWAAVDGAWGIPQPTISPAHLEGLTRDGKQLLVGMVGPGSPTLFAVIETHDLQVANKLMLSGSFAYDALSPDGKTLYLTQFVDRNNATRYVVRAYDLEHDRLLPGRVADKTQAGWVMQGSATTRTTSADGRWVYTLFMRPGGYPFVHALDTVRGVAHCIGLPWHAADQSALTNMRMTLENGGSKLALHWKSGKPWLVIDAGTWRITHPRASSFPLRSIVSATAALLVLFAAALILGRRRRSAHAHTEALPQPL